MSDGGLGQTLVGEKIMINNKHVSVVKLLGEGGFSFVYLVREIADTSGGQSLNSTVHGGEGATQRGSGSGRSGSLGNGKGERRSIGNTNGGPGEKKELVLKVTSILSRQQRDIAEKEAKLLSRLSHPSIIKMFDTCYRTVSHAGSKKDPKKDRPQHLILMEYCDGGHALDVCTEMVSGGTRFDLSTLIIAFGQICNAVSYLHAQRPPIVHRDLKPSNFLVKNGAYKLCDFGSAVFGHVDLKTPEARREAEEVIERTTTQMFRAPEMVDLYMAKKLTQSTDVWALGCCFYSLAFLQNCFEEGSNLAILSGKYKIPEDNPYGEGLVELIDRMLTLDCKARADMTEVILCLSAVYSGRPLPARKDRSKKKEGEKEKDKDRKEKSGDKDRSSSSSSRKKKDEKADPTTGTFRTNSQGVIYGEDLALDPELAKKAPTEKRKVDPNSALARRLAAAGKVEPTAGADDDKVDDFAAFPASSADFSVDFENTAAFGEFNAKADVDDGGAAFAGFDAPAGAGVDIDEAFGVPTGAGSDWGEGSESNGTKFDAFSSFSPDGVELIEGNLEDVVDADDKEEGDVAKGSSDHHRRRKLSKPTSTSSSDDADEDGGEADKGRRGQLRRTRSSARRSKRDVHKSGEESEELGVVPDSLGDESKHRHSSRPSSRGKREGVRRSASNPDDLKEAAEKARKEARPSSSRHSSSSRKPTKSKDDEDKPDP
ncbi:hypothetical protein MPSEU_000778900 [Mayamaea pseudoterrestris]|nr:hypothetical protein MPSEU_000778900 [Mayamaea pseudoterrestris]